MDTSALGDLSRKIETAAAAEMEASAALALPLQRHDQIVRRLGELAAQRAAIVARRAGGNPHAADRGDLELISVDAEGLQAMLPAAEAAAHEARVRHQAAVAAVAGAQAAYAAEEARQKLGALDAHAAELADLLAETLIERAAAAAALPPADRDPDAIIAIGKHLEGLTYGQIQAARALAAFSVLPYGSRPRWVPNEDFASEIQRLKLNSGRF